MSDYAPEAAVQTARAILRDFEDESVEIQDGSLMHAIEELENAQRNLPDY